MKIKEKGKKIVLRIAVDELWDLVFNQVADTTWIMYAFKNDELPKVKIL
jgi:hypothetical protein